MYGLFSFTYYFYPSPLLLSHSSAVSSSIPPSTPSVFYASLPPFLPLLLSHPSLLAVGGVLWFQADEPGVGGDHVATPADLTGVGALVELVGHDAQIPVLDDDIARD